MANQGKWIRRGSLIGLIDDYYCSCCNSAPPTKKVGITWGWDFKDICPVCGASMTKEDK